VIRRSGNLGLERKKNIYKTVIIIFTWMYVVLPIAPVYAGSPLEEVKNGVDQIIAILDDKSFCQSHTKEEVSKRLIETTHKGFDWEQIARRSLGLYWKERTQDEKKEFTSLFTKLLEDTYTNKIMDSYSGERVFHDKEIIDGNRALVESRIINKAEKEVNVGYRLLKKGEKWVVYDVIIEGVSMIKNYRVQFYSIIRQSSYNELINKLREKQMK